MGFLSKLVAGAIQGTVGTAIGVAKDVVTFGGALTDDEPETFRQLKQAGRKLEESVDDLADGEIL